MGACNYYLIFSSVSKPLETRKSVVFFAKQKFSVIDNDLRKLIFLKIDDDAKYLISEGQKHHIQQTKREILF